MGKESKPMVRLKRSLTTDNLWLYILSTLKEGDTYAYALKTQIEKRFGWKPGLITSYIVFYKLESEGLIKSQYKGRRKYYEITKKGRDTLTQGKRMIEGLSRKL